MRLSFFTLSLLLLLACGLISCRTEAAETVEPSTPTAVPTVRSVAADPTATPPAVPEPGKHLTICMSQEPSTLYWHGRATVFDEAVLHGIYENDLTTLFYSYQPQGLETVPNLAQGDASFRVIQVDAGDKVIDAEGDVVTLEPGVVVISADGATVPFDGTTLFMQQLIVDFRLKQRFWADGKPVTATDSVYSFQLAANPENPGDKFKIERTASYQATSNLSVRWAGLPGFIDDSFQSNFYHPLPQHAWQGLSETELPTAALSSRRPLGDGPYQIAEWLPGDMIRLEPNPYYYRAQEGIPRLDSVTFLFMPDSKKRISELLAGNCHIVTHDGLDRELIPFFLEAQDAQLLKAYIQPGTLGWQISFGVNSWGDYGDGAGRPDWFEEPRVRQAVAKCINRQQIIDSTLAGQSYIPHSYLPRIHPLYAANLRQWPFDQAAANILLDEAGYLDNNFDGIREDPISGADFRVSLITSQDRAEREIAQMIKDYLLPCGIDLEIDSLHEQLRFASGIANRINGRRYDLALISTQATHIPTCDQFTSSQISGPIGEQDPLTGGFFAGWDGKNHSGWSDPDYDAACTSAQNVMPGTVDYALYHEQAQLLFSENLPALPLFFSPRITAVVPEIDAINNDPSQNSELWNLSDIDLLK